VLKGTKMARKYRKEHGMKPRTKKTRRKKRLRKR
jgi:hypothetical protein